jgi:hypothetical protein
MALRFLADHCVSNFIVQTLLKQPMSGIRLAFRWRVFSNGCAHVRPHRHSGSALSGVN